MQRQIETLYKIFWKANEYFCNNEVTEPTITIQTCGRTLAYGWVSVEPIWKGNNEKSRELNISAEFANRPFFEIVATLLHELAHLWNLEYGIQDCSRNNQYHNKNFKKAAEKCGLVVTQTKKFGFAKTEVSQETKEIIRNWGIDENVFNKARIDFELQQLGKGGNDGEKGKDEDEGGNDGEKGKDEDEAGRPKPKKKKTSSRKWVCPECGTIIRSTKDNVNVICGDCGVPFEKEE